MNDIREAAFRALTRREHSHKELAFKLTKKGFDPTEVNAVLDQMEKDNWLSDARFTQMFVQTRINQGHGPVRIRYELKQRGVSDELISLSVDNPDISWVEYARNARRKKFGDASPETPQARAKQMRFLAQRGFDGSQTNAAMRDEYE
ncbi:MAG: regulatory protein RecX [Pseudomonadota bacterium]